ncbi:MAG TPA: mechanosensitive ion channel [Bacteroidia bacterium]|nr:mechanosensitive ion channel [Bacteroidia bacterium]HNU33369.1 mechanosensitive ion channel [Bacteroidia bacterium]
MNDYFLEQKFLGNTLESYLWFAGILIAGLIFRNLISKLFSYLFFNLLSKHFKTVGVDKFSDLLARPFSFFILVVIVFLAFDRLEFPHEWKLVPGHQFGVRLVLFRLFQIAVIFSITWVLLRVTDYIGLVLTTRAEKTESRMDDQLVPFIKSAIKILLCVVSLMIVLGKVFELNVASIIAGLGIGGLAIALASKDTLENLLGSFLIFLDRPFTIGDLVQVGSLRGHVEEIGFRSTKIRTLDKTLVTVPNKRMTDAELENQTERTFVRNKIILGLTYSTTKEQLQNFIGDVKDYLSNHKQVEKDFTVHFINFGASSLDVEIVFFANTSSVGDNAIIRDEVNFSIMDLMRKNNCSFAYPTQTVYLESDLLKESKKQTSA